MARLSPYRVWKIPPVLYRCKCGQIVQKRIDADTGKNLVLNGQAPRIDELTDERMRRFERYPADALHWLTCAARKKATTI